MKGEFQRRNERPKIGDSASLPFLSLPQRRREGHILQMVGYPPQDTVSRKREVSGGPNYCFQLAKVDLRFRQHGWFGTTKLTRV